MKRSAIQTKPPAPRICDTRRGGCGKEFTPARSMQRACSPACAREFAARVSGKKAVAAARADRKATRAALEAIEPRGYWLKKAEKAVNRYVRARDHDQGCISCHLPATWGGQWHASHFRSVAAASSIRYHLWNIRKACSACNHHKSGNIGEYRPRLIALIGAERVDWLSTQTQRADYSVDYLKRLAGVFNRKAARKERWTEGP